MCATGLNFAPPFENKLRQAERKRESEIDWQAQYYPFHLPKTDLRNLENE